jgi:hypothetical protein
MNKWLSAAIVEALMPAAVPGWAQTNSPQISKCESGDESYVQGLPGNKSGSTVKPPDLGR